MAGPDLAAVATLCPDGVLALDLDDTLLAQDRTPHRRGGQLPRHGSAPPAAKWCTPTGWNLVVLTLRITPPWGGEPLGLPVNMRVNRKGGPTHNELAEAMIEQVARWLDDRTFRLGRDGAYASLAGRNLPRTHVFSTVTPRRRPVRPGAAAHRQAWPAPQERRPAAHPRTARRPDHARLAARQHRPARQMRRAARALPPGAVEPGSAPTGWSSW
ncbi:MAG: hypothetical protein ACRD0K_23625 [Egibacteraceae bacterium]